MQPTVFSAKTDGSTEPVIVVTNLEITVSTIALDLSRIISI